MFIGSLKPKSRRTDFASPFLDHAKRTAVLWYGEPVELWAPYQVPKKDKES